MGRVPLEGPEDFRGYRGRGRDVRALRDVAVLVGLELDADDLAVRRRVRGGALRDYGRPVGARGLRAARLLVAYAVARLEAAGIRQDRDIRSRAFFFLFFWVG